MEIQAQLENLLKYKTQKMQRIIFTLIIVLQSCLGFSQTETICDKHLNTAKNTYSTLFPIRDKDKIIYFTSTEFGNVKSEVTMHLFDTCGTNYKEVLIPTKGIGVGAASIESDNTILFCTGKYISDTLNYPIIFKFDLSGKILFESKPIVFPFPYPLKAFPTTFEKVADGYIIGAYNAVYENYGEGLIIKLDLQGNFLWLSKTQPFNYTPIGMRILTNGDIEVIASRSSGILKDDIYLLRYNKEGKLLSSIVSKTNTTAYQEYCYKGIYDDGKWIVLGLTFSLDNLDQADALIKFFNDSLQLQKRYTFPPDTLNKYHSKYCSGVEIRNNTEWTITYEQDAYDGGILKAATGIFRLSTVNDSILWKKEYEKKDVAYNSLSTVFDKNTIFQIQTIEDKLPSTQYHFYSKLSYNNGECQAMCAVNSVKNIEVGSFSIFPNPGENDINISFDDYTNDNQTVKIFDSRGYCIHTEKLEQNTKINTEDWANGIYLVSFIDKWSRVIITSKWIKF
jgi:hypothetical protein